MDTASLLLSIRLSADADCANIERAINELNDASWKYIKEQTPVKGLRDTSEIDTGCEGVIEQYLPQIQEALKFPGLKSDELSLFLGANARSKKGELSLMWQLIPNYEARAKSVAALFRKYGAVSVTASALGDAGIQELGV